MQRAESTPLELPALDGADGQVPAVPPVENTVVRSVGRNTLIMLVSQMITFGLTFVWTVALQRTLGLTEYGTLFYAQTWAWIGAIFIDSGVSTYLSKQVAREREETVVLLSNAVILRTISTALVYVLILGTVALLGESQETIGAVAIVTASIVLASYTQALASTFQGHENMLPPALGTIAEKTVVTTLSVTLLLLGYGLLPVAGAMLLGAACNLAIVARRGLKNGWFRLKPDRAVMVRILKGGAPFFLWAAFGVIYQRNAGLQLEALTDKATTAWFGAAVRLYETLSFVPNIFMVAVLPVLARSFAGRGGVDSHATSRRSLDLIVLAAMPIAVLVVVLAPWIIELVTSGRDTYSGSIVPLQILGLSLIPLYVDIILATILISADKQRQWAYVAVGAALINPLFNWLLIRWSQGSLGNGAVGSALVTLLTESVIFFFYLVLVPRGVLTKANASYALRAAIAGALMALATWAILPWLTDFAAQISQSALGAVLVLLPAGLIGAAVFVVAAVALKLFGPAELQLVRRALKRG